jgi:hypothetical protein
MAAADILDFFIPFPMEFSNTARWYGAMVKFEENRFSWRILYSRLPVTDSYEMVRMVDRFIKTVRYK